MDPVRSLADLMRLHSAADTTLIVLVGVLLLCSLALFGEASTWWQMRGWHVCPCGCGAKVRNCPQRQEAPEPAAYAAVEVSEPPKEPAYSGRHRRGTDDDASRAGDVSMLGREMHKPGDNGIRVGEIGGPFYGPAPASLLAVWGTPPDGTRGVPGGVAGEPVPGGEGAAVGTASGAYAEPAADDSALSASA